MPQIRPAQESEYPLVRGFYYALIDAMENAEFKPGWEKDVYPAPEFLTDSIRNGEVISALTSQLPARLHPK